MKFFQSLVNSLYNISWLQSQKHKPKKPWGYFFLLLSLIALVHIIIGFTIGSKKIVATWEDISQQINSQNSEEINFGEIFATFSSAIKEAKENGVVITTDDGQTVKVDAEMIKSSLGDKGDVVAKQLDVLGSSAENMKAGIMAMGGLLLFMVIFLMLVALGFLVGGKLLYLLLLSWIFSKVSNGGKEKWSVNDFFGVGLYAITLPTILNWLILPWLGVAVPYLYTLIMIILFGCVLYWKKVDSTN